jgi:hypothetical protein
VSNLLGAASMKRAADDFRRVVQQAHSVGLALDVDETNSVNGGGTPGVSNVFASALWGTDYLFTAAEQGVAAVQFHGSGGGVLSGPYVPIQLDPHTGKAYPTPLYYGMLLFHLATASGGRPLSTSTKSAVNIAAHAVETANGGLQVVLINKDSKFEANVQLNVAIPRAHFSAAKATWLLAPSLTSTSGITLGGVGIADNGTWSPKVPGSVKVTGSTLNIAVPPASALLLTMNP